MVLDESQRHLLIVTRTHPQPPSQLMHISRRTQFPCLHRLLFKTTLTQPFHMQVPCLVYLIWSKCITWVPLTVFHFAVTGASVDEGDSRPQCRVLPYSSSAEGCSEAGQAVESTMQRPSSARTMSRPSSRPTSAAKSTRQVPLVSFPTLAGALCFRWYRHNDLHARLWTYSAVGQT